MTYRSVETSMFENVARRMGEQAEELKRLSEECREQTSGLCRAAEACERLVQGSMGKAARLTFATWALAAVALLLAWVTGREWLARL